MKPMIKGKKLAWLFAYVYFASYVTRINFSAVIQEVVTSTGFEKSALSVILVCMSVSYGVGQIINGWIGDRIKPQNLIFTGLCTATAINIIFPFFSASIPMMCLLWTVNGFAQAMMWPPIVKIMVNTMDEATYGSASVIVSLGSSIGTIAVYLTAPVIITLLSWQFVLLLSAATGLFAVILWAFIKNRVYDEKSVILPNKKSSPSAKLIFPQTAIFPLIFIALAIICQGMLRDGVSN
jgi:OPA family glycerol-3-phosphate transporter-like MFS transporter